MTVPTTTHKKKHRLVPCRWLFWMLDPVWQAHGYYDRQPAPSAFLMLFQASWMSDSSHGASLWILVLLHGWLRWLQGKISVWVLCRSGPADCLKKNKQKKPCMSHPRELRAHSDTPLLLDVICMNSKVWLDQNCSSRKYLSFKHTPHLSWSRLWQFNLSMAKQFNAPSPSVTKDYRASHCKEHFFVSVGGTLFVCVLAFFSDTSLLCSLLSYDCPRLRKRLFRKATWTSWNSHKILVHLQLFRKSLELSKNIHDRN